MMKCKICSEKVEDRYVDGVLKRFSYKFFREPGDWEQELHNCNFASEVKNE